MKNPRGSAESVLVYVVAGLVALGLASTPALAVGAEPGDVTFSRDVAPILQRSCENCHRAGAAGGMSLITYQDVRPWARSTKNRTSSREMPPWFIDKNIGI